MNISNVILSSNYGLPHPLNAQTLFDKCALHLIHQGRRSIRKEGVCGCAYRGADGAACAVGALISEDRYSEDMEGDTAQALASTVMPELKPFELLLQDIQDAHDYEAVVEAGSSAINMPGLIRAFEKIANEHGLSADVLEDAQPVSSAAEVIAPALPAEITSLLRPSPVKTEA